MTLNFRKLRADEIDVRIGSTKSQKGTSLLLYKDARCDMNILDETVGALNWKREHTRENANCIVSIWDEDKKHWVSKEDTGTESNTEKEKGLASDSSKRSCFNWGIGRELYTAGFTFIPVSVMNKDDIKYARFEVSKVTYDEFGNIDELIIKVGDKVILNKKGHVKEEPKPKAEPTVKKEPEKATQKQVDELIELVSPERLLKIKEFYMKRKIAKLEDIDFETMTKLIALELKNVKV